jgi:dynein heavy chain
VNEEVSFLIQAKDDNNSNRTTGGDEFSVIITMLGGGENGENHRLSGVGVEDLENGRYLVSYKVKYVGRYEIKVDFLGTFGGKAGELRGSGIVIEFPANASRDNNAMTGGLIMSTLRTDISYLTKYTEDMSKTVLTRVKDDSWSSDEQVSVLMKIKEALLTIEAQSESISLLVEKNESIIAYMNEKNIKLDGMLEEHLFQAKYLWEKILKEAPQIQSKISPMMRSHNNKIKSDIVSYEAHITSYKNELMKSEFYLFATGKKTFLFLSVCFFFLFLRHYSFP